MFVGDTVRLACVSRMQANAAARDAQVQVQAVNRRYGGGDDSHSSPAGPAAKHPTTQPRTATLRQISQHGCCMTPPTRPAPKPARQPGGKGSVSMHPAPGDTVTPAPTKAKPAAAKTSAATTTATDAPPGDRVTPTRRPAAAKMTAAAECTVAGAAKGAPGFTVVFAIAGMLAVAYAMMRRRG